MAFEHETVLNPVTALCFVHAAHQTLLLAGEGPFLTVYEHGSAAAGTTGILLQQRIFKSQAVHGIVVEESASPRPPRVLVWGGYSVRVVEILFQFDRRQPKPTPRLAIVSLGPELNAVDWILDASISPPAREDSHVRAALVTAHNSLHLLRLPDDNGHSDLQTSLPATIGSASRSILYSAHVLWVSGNRVLVAAGTVFGEIILWSCELGDSQAPHRNKSTAILHYTLTGHEGSVFGVQISPLLNLGKKRPQRLLASCSDDRTIRIWDISAQSAPDVKSLINTSTDTGFSVTGDLAPEGSTRSRNLIAIGWGHASRVWGVRFIGRHREQAHILSFGEDATCRRWSLERRGGAAPNTAVLEECLNPIQTYSLHSGKHVWSLAVTTDDTSLLISTGGSDGKIASVSLPLCADGTIINQRCDLEWTLEDFVCSIRPYMSVCEVSGSENPRSSPDRTRTPNEGSRTNITSEHGNELTKSKLTRKAGIPTPEILKDYAFVSRTEFLTSTTQGRIFLCRVESPRESIGEDSHSLLKDNVDCQVCWKSLVDLDMLGSYPVIAGDPASRVAFLSGQGGVVYQYDLSSGEIEPLFQIDGKVSGLFPIPSPCLLRVVLTCAGSRKAHFGTLRANRHHCPVKFEKLPGASLISLELPESFVVTSAGAVDTQNLIFLGSRSGALAVYNASYSSSAELALLTCLRRVHGFDAITVITPLPGHSGSVANTLIDYILTSGRNGTYAIHQISSENRVPTVTTVHIATLPFGPMIEGAYFYPFSQDLILYGFRSKSFIVWNESKECEIMNVECGGAHRNWAFSPSFSRIGGGIFVWTKSSRLHMHIQSVDSHQVVKRGGHGREIKALAISPPLTLNQGVTRQVLATGSEDTTIRIFEIGRGGSDGSTTFKALGTFRKHATGVQHLQWTDCGRYLLSSGGMEEFFIWRVRWIPGFGIGGYCESICPAGTNLPNLRIVSFATKSVNPLADAGGPALDVAEFIITMVYSDSTIKTYRYSSRDRSFQLVLRSQYSTCCLTQVFHQDVKNQMYILTAGTDGYIALWKVRRQMLLINHENTSDAEGTGHAGLAKWHWRSRSHQSSIKSMVVMRTTPESLLTITGGDDNALVLTHIEFGDGRGDISSSTTRIPKAHASAVTALVEFPSPDPQRIKFASSSNDQRLKLWSVVLRGKEVDVNKEGSVGTAVADVSGMVVSVEGDMRVVVSGVGMEIWKVKSKGIIG